MKVLSQFPVQDKVGVWSLHYAYSLREQVSPDDRHVVNALNA